MHLEQIKQLVARCCLLDARFFCPHSVEGCGCSTPLTKLPPAWIKLLEDSPVAGFIWFKENLDDVEQIRQLNSQVYAHYADNQELTPLLAIDQEGGRVFRTPLAQTTSFAGQMALGAADNVELSRKVSNHIAKELRSFGFNYNFTPCVDINNNPNNPVINVRAFGDSAAMVSKHGAAVCEGMRDYQVLNSIKHFPGHGNTATDSHVGLPRIEVSAASALKMELAPFAKLIEQGMADSVMTAHIQFPAFDSKVQTLDSGASIMPLATTSEAILQGLLREKLGFTGVIVTDALDMGAVADLMSAEEAAYRALIAGADLLLMPKRMQSEASLSLFDDFLSSVAKRLQENPQHIASLQASVKRVDHLRKSAVRGVEAYSLRSAEALDIERQLIHESLVSLDNFNTLTPGCSVDVIASDLVMAQLMCRALQSRGVMANTIDCLESVGANPLIVISQTPAENAVDSGRAGLHCGEQTFSVEELRMCASKSTDCYWLSVRSPYDLMGLKVGARFACFNYKTAIDATGQAISPLYGEFAHLLLGEWQAVGQLPVAL